MVGKVVVLIGNPDRTRHLKSSHDAGDEVEL